MGSNSTGLISSLKGEIWTWDKLRGRSCEETQGEDGASISQGEKPGVNPSLTALRRNPSCWYLNLGHLDWRTVREYISAVLATQCVTLCYSSPCQKYTQFSLVVCIKAKGKVPTERGQLRSLLWSECTDFPWYPNTSIPYQSCTTAWPRWLHGILKTWVVRRGGKSEISQPAGSEADTLPFQYSLLKGRHCAF